MTEPIEVEDKASAGLARILGRAKDLKPMMTAMGRRMVISVRTNFNEGGRPVKWAPLKGVVVLPKNTRRKGQRTQAQARMGGPLVLTGDLRAEIGFTAQAQDLLVWASPQNDPIKAPVHQYGTDRAGRGHNTVIPARPYLLFQQEDIQWFLAAVDGFIRVGTLE